MAFKEPWRAGVAPKQRPDGNVRFSQVISTFGPGALIDLVDDAAIVAGLSFWAKGAEISEDRLVQMLRRQEGYEQVRLFAPPHGGEDPEASDRRWIQAFRFPQWFTCSNEKCWEDSGQPARRDRAHPRRLLHASQLDGKGHRCKGSKGAVSKVQPVRFIRACRMGHIDDLEWNTFLHRKHGEACRRPIFWIDEAGSSGDLTDVRVTCSGCGANVRMSLATQLFTEQGPTLGHCSGRMLWLGSEAREECKEPMRFLLRSASHAYFPVTASVIHIPDAEGILRDRVGKVYELIKDADEIADIQFFRRKQAPVRSALDGFTDEAVMEEVRRRKEDRPVPHRKVKDAEVQVLMNPSAIQDDAQRFSGRLLPLPRRTSGPMARVDRVVLLDRLVEVRALVGFTRFEPRTADRDGELDLGAEVVKPDAPHLTWLPAVEHVGEGFFFSLNENMLSNWEREAASREQEFLDGFAAWQRKRKDRAKLKPDFASARFVLLHSLSHLLITAVSLECGYSASSIRERIYASQGGSGILLYTASPGAEGSLGGLAEVGRNLERYLEKALDLGRLCANDPVCAAHIPEHQDGGSDRHLDGASCHGCLLISEPSCERMNAYLDRSLVVPTLERSDLAFFKDDGA